MVNGRSDMQRNWRPEAYSLLHDSTDPKMRMFTLYTSDDPPRMISLYESGQLNRDEKLICVMRTNVKSYLVA